MSGENSGRFDWRRAGPKRRRGAALQDASRSSGRGVVTEGSSVEVGFTEVCCPEVSFDDTN